ncbi:ADP-ribosylglycohydrolase family protein [Saccharopolyspora sp. NPDC049426]|uniref:ADP-ribosylglycohydrolase family protein n=1 Tax=Saccharopolyspora sp. NPDC049426 TaxID=3155652 RepID=UPI003449C35B
MTDPQRQLSWADRFRGALLGGAVGDALGAGVRHTSTAEIQQWFGPRGVVDYLPVYGRRGAVTDLTQLTVFTLEGLLRAKAEGCTGLPTEFVFANHLRWLHTQGVPWEFAMSAFAATEPAPTSWLLERRELYSTRNPAGNALGLLGRMAARSPLGPDGRLHPPVDADGSADYPVLAAPAMVWSNVPEGVYAAGAGIANLYTSGANSVAAAGVHADVLAQLIRGIPLWDAVTSSDQRRLNAAYRVAGVPADVRRTVHAAMFTGQRGGTPGPLDIDIEFDVADKPGELGIALAAVGSTRTFADAVQVAVNNSADSAVTGALAGQLAGALHGPAAIPAQWLDELELRQVIETLCGDATEAFAPPPPPQWAQRYTRGPQQTGPRQIPAGPAKTVEGSAEQTMVMPAITADTPPPAAPLTSPRPAAPEPPVAQRPVAPQPPVAPEPPVAQAPAPEPVVKPEPPAREEIPRFEVRNAGQIGAPTFPASAPAAEPERETETTAVFAAIGSEPDQEPDRTPVDLEPRPRAPIDLHPGEADEPEPEVAEPAPIPETPVVDLEPEPEPESETETTQVVEAVSDSGEPAGSTVVDVSGIGSPFDLIAVPTRDDNEPEPDARFTRDSDPELRFADAEPEPTPIDLRPDSDVVPNVVPALAKLSSIEPEPEPVDEEVEVVAEEADEVTAEPEDSEGEVAEAEVAETEDTEPEHAEAEFAAPEDNEPEDVQAEDTEPEDTRAEVVEEVEDEATEEPQEVEPSETEPGEVEWDELGRGETEQDEPELHELARDETESDETELDETEPDEVAFTEEPEEVESATFAGEPAEDAAPELDEPEDDVTTEDAAADTEDSAAVEPEDTVVDVGEDIPAEAEPQVVEALPISVGRRVHGKSEGPGDAAPSLTERVLGCFLGGALGDALGADLEFITAAQITERFGATGPSGLREAYGVHGAITDDTQMTLFTAEGLIRGSVAARTLGAVDPLPEVQLAYQRWLHTQGVEWDAAAGEFFADHPVPDGWLIEVAGLFHTRAPGKTIFRALTAFGDGHRAGSLTEKINDSKGCGGAMRAAPVALTSTDPAEVFELAARTAALTHSHPAGYHSAGALAVIVQQALLGRSLDDGVWLALQVLETWDDHEETTAAIKAAVDLAAEGVPTPERVAEVLGGGWVGEQAVAIAVCAALVAGEDVELALKIAVHHDGDSDSTGAICGNIVGALQGVSALPLDWLAELELRDVIEQMALDCVAEFGRGGFQPGRAAIDPPSDQDWNERYPVRPQWSSEPATVGADAGGFPSPKPAPRRRLDGVASTETVEGDS